MPGLYHWLRNRPVTSLIADKAAAKSAWQLLCGEVIHVKPISPYYISVKWRKWVSYGCRLSNVPWQGKSIFLWPMRIKKATAKVPRERPLNRSSLHTVKSLRAGSAAGGWQGENLKYWNPENLAGWVPGQAIRMSVFQVFSFPVRVGVVKIWCRLTTHPQVYAIDLKKWWRARMPVSVWYDTEVNHRDGEN